MSSTISQTAPVEEPPAKRPFAWRVVGVLGEILITVGVLFLLMVVYELWWTSVEAEQEHVRQREQLILAWEEEEVAADPVETPPIPAEAFGLMYIPRLGDDVWATPLIEGVTDYDLTRGIGHFPESALPGAVGNTSFAAHRATYGEPLANVDQLELNDRVYVETAGQWHTYRLTRDQIVLPTDVWVVDPVPGQPAGTTPTESLITLVTCEPRWGSTHRWIWWGELVESVPKTDGPPAEIAELLVEGV